MTARKFTRRFEAIKRADLFASSVPSGSIHSRFVTREYIYEIYCSKVTRESCRSGKSVFQAPLTFDHPHCARDRAREENTRRCVVARTPTRLTPSVKAVGCIRPRCYRPNKGALTHTRDEKVKRAAIKEKIKKGSLAGIINSRASWKHAERRNCGLLCPRSHCVSLQSCY